MLPTPANMPARFTPIADICGGVFVTTQELALRWRYSPGALSNWRGQGVGIPYVKYSGLVRYRLSEILTYELNNTAGPLTVERVAVELSLMSDVPAALAKTITARLADVMKGAP
jgi:hypothetical protein